MTTSRLAESAGSRRRQPTVARRWIAAGSVTALVVAVIRLWISRGRDEFSLWPDEPAQLAMARFLGGGVPWTMHDHSTWQPGYATLLSPVHWFTDDPVSVFHAALMVNAVLGGVAAGLLLVLTRRLTPLTPWAGATVAGLVALTPAVLFPTVLVWSESLVAVCFLVTVIALLRYAELPTIGRGALTAIGAAVAFGTHSRMLPLAVVTIGLAAVLAIRRESSGRAALAVAAITAAAMATVRRYTGWIVDRLWDDPAPTNSLGGAIRHVRDAPVTTVLALAGQVWYLVVASIGLVVYGSFVTVRAVRGGATVGAAAATAEQAAPVGAGRVPAPGLGRRDALVLSAVVLLGVAPSVLFMAGRSRPDQVVYGRYNDVVVLPLVIVGLAFLVAAPRVRHVVVGAVTAVGISVVGAAMLVMWRSEALEAGTGIQPMILGLQPYAGDAESIQVVRITVLAAVAIVFLAASAVVARRVQRPALLLACTAIVVVAAAVRTERIISDGWDGRGDLSAVGELADAQLAGGAPVEFLLPDGQSSDRLMLYQLYLPHNRLRVIEAPADGSTPYLFAPIDNAELERSATLVWTDPYRKFGLWHR